MAHLLAPSILSADFGILKEQVEIINNSKADLIHVDVMDGVFVPNISFGFTVLDSLVKFARKPLDIHLMIVEPDRYIERFAAYHPEYLTIHYEACPHLHRTVEFINSYGVKAGVALNPHTPVNFISEIINILDLLLIMSVNPGYGGQKFIKNSLNKILEAKKSIEMSLSSCKIQVDGGIGFDNINPVVNSGADIIVAGNTVFKSADIMETISKLKDKVHINKIK